MQKYRIFVSGVQKELKAERLAVKEAIAENPLFRDYFNVFLFEEAPAKGKSAKSSYIDEVQKSDIYIGILGNEYGKVSEKRISPTEQEFHEAKKKGKEILIYIKGKDDKKRDKRIQKLIAEIRNPEAGHSYKRFDNKLGLKHNIFESLVEFLRYRGIVGRGIFDEMVCDRATLKEIDKEKVKWFLRLAKQERNYPLPLNTSAKDTLTHLNLLRDGKVTNAAILLFGKNPKKYHLQAEIKCLQFHGVEVEKPFASYHIYSGNLFEQVDKSVAFVLDMLNRALIQQSGTVAVKRPYEIPEFVVHEAIVNALAHRDYNCTAGVQVMCFVDRIEIWNPGGLSQHLTIEKLKRPHGSFPRNPLLAEVLFFANYIQKAGSGTLEMVKQCRAAGVLEPEFLASHGEFRAIIARDILTESVLSKYNLNERQIKAVKYVKNKGKITNNEYQSICSVGKRQSTNDLKDLERKGIFDRIGKTGKGTYYIIKQRGTKGAKGA